MLGPPFMMKLFSIASYPSTGATWTDSSSFCVWKSHRRGQRPGLAEAITRILPLHPSSLHPDPTNTYLSYIAVISFPSQPYSHGSLDDECWADKPYPAWIQPWWGQLWNALPKELHDIVRHSGTFKSNYKDVRNPSKAKKMKKKFQLRTTTVFLATWQIIETVFMEVNAENGES